MQELERTAPAWKDALTLAPGFPQVVESSCLPGLKPGFFVVLAGICPVAEGEAALARVKPFGPGTYARSVTWAGKLGCPTPGGWHLEGKARQKRGGAELTSLLLRPASGQGFRLELLLRDKAGKLLERKSVADPCQGRSIGCQVTASVDEEGAHLTGSEDRPGACTEQDTYDVALSWEIKGSAIREKDEGALSHQGRCD